MDDILKKYIKHGEPFGPINADIIKTEHRSVLKALFDPQNKIYDALRNNPSLIIGRRGSGKTAYLHSAFIDDQFGIIQEMKTAKTFSQIIFAIEKDVPAAYLSENIAELWEEFFYLALISAVAYEYKNEAVKLKKINDYLAKKSLKKGTSADTVLWKVVQSLRTVHTKSGPSMIGAIANIVNDIAGIEFEDAKEITIELLKKKGVRAILLLDSLEQFEGSIQSVANAMSGLLKCVGQFNERNEQLNIRFCLPAELYFLLLNVSSNPLKDFSHPITLHWIAGELLSVAAHRLSLYLRLYYPTYPDVPQKDLSKREDIQAFLYKFFPAQITNSLGGTEDTLAYLLRHTQLQPRHLLMYLNEVFIEQKKIDNSFYPRISEQAIKKAISNKENLLCQEVFSGYRVLYPNAGVVCKACIPELPLVFDNNMLRRIFTRKGEKASGYNDYWDFRDLLTEMGIVGKVIDETDRYHVGKFEYTEPHKLVVSDDDKLCLHPVFAEVFNFNDRQELPALLAQG